MSDGRSLLRGLLVGAGWNATTLELYSPSGTQMQAAVHFLPAGCCSEAARRQVAEFEKSQWVLHLDLASFTSVDEMLAAAPKWCDEHWQVQQAEKLPRLVSTRTQAEPVAAARAKFAERCAADYSAADYSAADYIAPGVTWSTTFSPPQLTLSLKSSNFGGPSFSLVALEMCL